MARKRLLKTPRMRVRNHVCFQVVSIRSIALSDQCAICNTAGANGFIVVDLPLEEEPAFFTACRTHEMSFVPLVAPTTRGIGCDDINM